MIITKGKLVYSLLPFLVLSLPVWGHNISIRHAPIPVLQEQQMAVHGTVTDATSGDPLPGVTVAVKGTSRGTTTDVNGKFTVNDVAENAVLVFSYIGYQTRAVRVNGKSSVDIVLKASVSELNQLVVIGYGQEKQKDVTGAISVIKPHQISHLPATRVDNILEGRIAGAQITSQSGAPGTGTTIEIRGSRSITASNEPLYVIDGVIGAGDLNTINPADIASIEVLKDASATAIYGSRGANGVIIITTKRGQPGKDVVTLNSSVGFAQLPRYLNTMNAEQLATYQNDIYLYGHPDAAVSQLPFPNPDTFGVGGNWTKAITRNAPFQSHTLSLSGGTRSFTYYISGNYTNEAGIIKTSGMKRYQFRVNLNKSFSKTFKAGLTLNYSNYTVQNNLVNIGSNAGWYYSTLTIPPPPMIPIYNADGSYGDWNPIWYSGNYINTPVALVNLEKDNSKFSTLLPDFFVSWELLPGLTLRSTFSYKDRNTYRYKYFPGTLPASEAKQQGGYAYQYSGPSDEILNNNLISYRHVWKNAHSLSVMAGWIYEKDENRNFIATGTGYFVDGMEENSLQSAPSKDQTSISSANSSQTIISALSRINYNYKQKYYLTLTGRTDGSSNFSINHKWAFFPSGAIKWRVGQEDFMKSIKSINNLDIRLSYGSTGNQAISPYQSLPKLAVNNNGYIFGGTIPVAYYPSSLPNTNLTWETSQEADLGLDIALLGNRINITADAYNTHTENLLLNIQIPQQTGYVTRLVNLGKTMNRGIEFTVNTTNIQSKEFTWSSIITYAHNEQKVLDLGPLVEVETHNNYSATQYPMYAYEVGLPTSSVFGAVYAGTWKSDADITANKNKYVSIPTFYHPGRPRYIDQNHDGLLDKNDIVYLGQADPKYYGGLDNDFTYKGFELDVYFEYSGGNVMYNDVELEMASGSTLTNQFAYMLDGWNAKTNPESNIPAPGSYDHVPNTRYVHNASYIRLKSARLGYNFDPQKWGIKGITHASFFISGLNLLLWTKYTGYDPEVNTEGTSSTVRRNDDGAYPPNRTIAANLSLTF